MKDKTILIVKKGTSTDSQAYVGGGDVRDCGGKTPGWREGGRKILQREGKIKLGGGNPDLPLEKQEKTIGKPKEEEIAPL